jgi:hypothetical protein
MINFLVKINSRTEMVEEMEFIIMALLRKWWLTLFFNRFMIDLLEKKQLNKQKNKKKI